MRLGAHMSVAGGLHNAFARGREATCESIQIFTKSNRRWKATPITDEDVKKYRKASEEHDDIHPVAVHASYLINIASPKPDLWQKSLNALKIEVERAGKLDVPYITFHPGSYVSSDEKTGLENIGRALRQLLEETADTAPDTIICLETMAGQGTSLAYKFEHLATMIEAVNGDERVGVCMDTCHVFSAGYDIRTPEAYEETMQEFDQIVGLDRIKFFHLNDSRHEFGERKDRHAHIGEGYIGEQGFANFVNDPRWAEHPAHLETPKTEEDEDGEEIEMDPINLRRLRDLIEEK